MASKFTLSELRKACSIGLGGHYAKVRREGERKWTQIPEMTGFLPYKDRAFSQPRWSFSTGLYDRGHFAPVPIFCREWHIDFRQTFALSDTALNDRVDTFALYGGHPLLKDMPARYGVSAPEALLFAKTQRKADEILEHINAAMILFNGYPPFERGEALVQRDALSTLPKDFEVHSPLTSRSKISVDGVFSSCQYVANIWSREHVRLALARLYHSTYVAHCHPLDASPSFGDFADFDVGFFQLTAYAIAITAAYSVVEELNCQPKVKRGDAVLNNGEWNPNVVAELRKRLSDAGFDPDEEVIWVSRGRTRIIESRVAPAAGKPAEWNRLRVKDRIIPLCEAILLCSRIRNRAAAHNTKQETRSLTPVDLMNVQSVCRHLLMTSGGMPVRTWIKKTKGVLEFHVS